MVGKTGSWLKMNQRNETVMGEWGRKLGKLGGAGRRVVCFVAESLRSRMNLGET